MQKNHLLLSLLVLCCASLSAHASEAPNNQSGKSDLAAALADGTFWMDARYRYETVHQQGIARDAQANTARTILGYNSGIYKGLKIQLAGLNNMQIGNNTFNDGVNGRTKYPSVSDPKDTQLFLANVNYSGLPDTEITVGRQRISFDNQRFIGAPAWRQIQQSYDAALIKNKSVDHLELAYGYVFHQNRSGGTQTYNGSYGMDTHLFHTAYDGIEGFRFATYSYLIDMENVKTLSSATNGVRIEAKHPLFGNLQATGAAEYARQTDYGNNPNSYAENYYLLEPGFSYQGLKGKFAYEYLGGNGRVAMQTPMMSGHNLMGWTDKFSTIPANGLENAFVELSYAFTLPVEWLDESKITAQWHNLNAAHISSHYGDEWGLDYTQNLGRHYAVGVQYENYIADRYLTDTQKVVVTGQVKF